MLSQLKRHLPPLLAFLLALFLLTPLLFPAHAYADNQLTPNTDKNLYYDFKGETFVIGVLYQDESGKNYYCMEVEKEDNGKDGTFKPFQNDESRQLAWLMKHYEKKNDRAAHAAIGILVHDAYDPNQELWAKHRLAILKENPSLESEIQQLKKEAEVNAPSTAVVEGNVLDGKRGELLKFKFIMLLVSLLLVPNMC